ncbi:MAG: hypothetical protein JW779_15225 [Candidatus Thorarchaeota archaeon]|nr:hypothetical protein [Candidatus Thorarchaeota archaeon]
MKDKLFLIGSLLAIIAGAIMTFFSLSLEYDSPMFVIMGIVLILLGFIVLVTGYTTPSVSQGKEGIGLSYIMIVASILIIVGTLDFEALWILMLIGGGLLLLSSIIIWPCFCCTGKSKNRDKVIGVANAHDNISMVELGRRTGMSIDVVRDIVYDALGKNHLSGHMEGDTFIRSRPTATAYSTPSTTTTEREIVKVLVVCPFCGAKNEQGTPRCHNCQASL